MLLGIIVLHSIVSQYNVLFHIFDAYLLFWGREGEGERELVSFDSFGKKWEF